MPSLVFMEIGCRDPELNGGNVRTAFVASLVRSRSIHSAFSFFAGMFNAIGVMGFVPQRLQAEPGFFRQGRPVFILVFHALLFLGRPYR